MTGPQSGAHTAGDIEVIPFMLRFAARRCAGRENRPALGLALAIALIFVAATPVMTAKINDVDVQFIIDSGAFYRMINAPSAAALNLTAYSAPFGCFVGGVGGGTTSASIAKVKTFTLVGVPLHNIDFLVGGSEFRGEAIGFFGRNVLHLADVEYDLGQGMVRLIKPKDCSKTTLAYWTTTTMPLSTMPIEPTTPQSPHTLEGRLVPIPDGRKRPLPANPIGPFKTVSDRRGELYIPTTMVERKATSPPTD